MSNPSFSYLHTLKEKCMLHAAENALYIEKATEGSLTLVVQAIALASGVIKEDDYVFDFTLRTGRRVTFLHQGKLFK